MKARVLSREEEAELTRSNKKVKDSHHANFSDRSGEDSPSQGNQSSWNGPKASFKDKLVGEIPGAFAQAFDFSDSMEADIESDDDEAEGESREGRVPIKLTRETKIRIRGPWTKAIFVKLVGRTVGFNYIQTKLTQLWKPSGRMDCVNLGYGFFLIRFYAKEDLDFVLQRGPWFIGDHFLSLRPWEPFFKPSTASVSTIAVWVRLNELPFELYDREVLRQIGEAIGRVLRIDTHTAMEDRGEYARLCVQVDMNKPLVNTVAIGRFEQLVTYEGVQSLCFACGRVGHRKEVCPAVIRKDKEKALPDETTVEVPENNSRSVHEAGRTDTCSIKTKASGTEEEEGLYGPWMVVTRKRNGHKGTKKGTNPVQTQKLGSRMTHAHSFEGPSHVAKHSTGGLNALAGLYEAGSPSMLGQFNLNGLQSNVDIAGNSLGAPKTHKGNLRNSVKGKKVIARGRISSPSLKSAVDPPVVTEPLKLSCFSNHGADSLTSAPFEFVANEEAVVDHQHVKEGDLGADVSCFNSQSLGLGAHGDSKVEAPLFQANPRCHTNLEVQPAIRCSGSNDGSTQSSVRPVEGKDGVDQMDSEDGSAATHSC
nr:hypothetical protein CFP56_27537 [Quercus suber]